MSNIGSIFGNASDVRVYLESSDYVIPNCCVGVEAELERTEGRRLEGLWETKTDGSLHDDGLEYCFSSPLFGKDINIALAELEECFTNTNVSTGEDTSLHVHIDVRDMLPEQLNRMFMLYVIFEQTLFNYCSKERESNIFCLSLDRAQAAIPSYANISTALLRSNTDDLVMLLRSMPRYAAMNVAAIHRFGSVEFRHHPGEWRAEPIKRWINILQSIKLAALNEQYDGQKPYLRVKEIGSHAFLREIFGEYAQYLDNEALHEQMFVGLQLARRIANYRTRRFSIETLGISIGTDLANNLRKNLIDKDLPRMSDLPDGVTAYQYHIMSALWSSVNDIVEDAEDLMDFIRNNVGFAESLVSCGEDTGAIRDYLQLAFDEGVEYAHDRLIDYLEEMEAEVEEEDALDERAPVRPETDLFNTSGE